MSESSKRIAADWGEKHKRTVSRVLADGLNSATGGDLRSDEAVDLIHFGMFAVPIAYLTSPKNAGAIAAVATAAAGILWFLGQDN